MFYLCFPTRGKARKNSDYFIYLQPVGKNMFTNPRIFMDIHDIVMVWNNNGRILSCREQSGYL